MIPKFTYKIFIKEYDYAVLSQPNNKLNVINININTYHRQKQVYRLFVYILWSMFLARERNIIVYEGYQLKILYAFGKF